MTDFAREYGGALYEVAREEGAAHEYLQELRALEEVFALNPDFVQLLSNLGMAKEERCQIVRDVFEQKVTAYILHFMLLLCERGALREFPACVTQFKDRLYEDEGIIEACAVCAQEMPEALRRKLTERLIALTGKKVLLSVRVDPALIGGIRLEMNGKRFDNTIKNRLESLRGALQQAME